MNLLLLITSWIKWRSGIWTLVQWCGPQTVRNVPQTVKRISVKGGGSVQCLCKWCGSHSERCIDTTHPGKLNYQRVTVSGRKQVPSSWNDELTLNKMLGRHAEEWQVISVAIPPSRVTPHSLSVEILWLPSKQDSVARGGDSSCDLTAERPYKHHPSQVSKVVASRDQCCWGHNIVPWYDVMTMALCLWGPPPQNL